MRRILFRFAAIMIMMAAATAAYATPAACFGPGCGQCNWECFTPETVTCIEGAGIMDKCECDMERCRTVECEIID